MRVMFVILILMASSTAFAQNGDSNRTSDGDSNRTSGGISDWELGFGLGVEQYRGEPYIDSASIRGEDRIVTTEKTYETRPSAWLNMNWNIFDVYPTKFGEDKIKFGFFVGVKLIDSNSEVFGAFALGPQFSFKTKNQLISIGAGWVTHQTKTYANGIEAGKALPEQYDDIVFEESTENSYMLMMSIRI